MKFENSVTNRSRISDQIKIIIKKAIVEGEFKLGDKLPTEDQLSTTFQVSKVSIREALRDLEGEGIIEKRRGIFGGNFVVQPGINKMHTLIQNYYQFGTITPQEIIEFGQLTEPTFVAVAARRRTDKDVERMRLNMPEKWKNRSTKDS